MTGRDENRVNERLTEHGPEKWEPVFRKDHAPNLQRRRFDAVALAASADDQGGGIEQRKALR